MADSGTCFFISRAAWNPFKRGIEMFKMCWFSLKWKEGALR